MKKLAPRDMVVVRPDGFIAETDAQESTDDIRVAPPRGHAASCHDYWIGIVVEKYEKVTRKRTVHGVELAAGTEFVVIQWLEVVHELDDGGRLFTMEKEVDLFVLVESELIVPLEKKPSKIDKDSKTYTVKCNLHNLILATMALMPNYT